MTATVHHDSLMAMIGALSLLWMVEALQRPPTWKGHLVASLLLSAGLLTKLSGLSLIALFGLVLVWIGWQQRSWRRLLSAGVIVYGSAAVLAGWWYIRNQTLYGDPLAWNLFLSSQQHMIRTGPYGWIDFVEFVGQLQRTFWGAFGYMHIMLPDWTYNTVWIIVGIAGLGLMLGLIRQRRLFSLRQARTMIWLILLAATGLWFVSFVRFSIATVGAAMSVLIVVGLSQLVPRRWSGLPGGLLSGGLFVYAIVCLVAVVPPLYPVLRTAQAAEMESVTLTDLDFGDSLRLIGYRVNRITAQAGADLQLDLYWQARGMNRPDLFAEVTLVDASDRLIGRSRRWPGDNGTSIQIWDLVKVYVDSRTLRVDDAVLIGDAQFILKVKSGRDGPAVSVSRAGQSLGEQAVLRAVRVQGQ